MADVVACPEPVNISVAGEDAEVPVTVSTRPASPLAENDATRCVVVPRAIVVAPVALKELVMLAKVLPPVMVSVPAPPWSSVMPE